MAKEKDEPVAKPGDMVIAKIGGKESAPLYFAQVVDGVAHLQGAVVHEAPISDIVRKA